MVSADEDLQLAKFHGAAIPIEGGGWQWTEFGGKWPGERPIRVAGLVVSANKPWMERRSADKLGA